jgi:hypothetical protein
MFLNFRHAVLIHVRFEALAVDEVNIISSGYQVCRLVKNYRRFRNLGNFFYQPTSVILNQLTPPISQENFISICCLCVIVFGVVVIVFSLYSLCVVSPLLFV